MKKLISILTIALIIAVACDEVFDEDISDDKITLLSPSDSLVSTLTTQTFKWESLDEASNYVLQLVSPTFDTTELFLLDSNLVKTEFTYSLSAGRYEWRVKAKNSHSETEYTTHKLIIKDTTDLGGQRVILVSPSDNQVFGIAKVEFKWDKLQNAKKYQINVMKNSLDGNTSYENSTENDTCSNVFTEGKYVWSVQGVSTTISDPVYRTFFVDLTAPNAPTVKSPSNGEEVAKAPVTIEWNYSSGELTPIVNDSLIIATEKTFAKANIKKSVKLSKNSYSFETTDTGDFYWKVKSKDKAGNWGEYSEIYHFKIKND